MRILNIFKRSTPITRAPDGLDILSAEAFWSWASRTSKANVPVDYRALQSLDAWRACDQLISNQVASTPIKIVEGEEGDYRPIPNHPLSRLLAYRPNELQTRFKFIRQAVHVLINFGNCYSIVDRSGPIPTSIRTVHPDAMSVSSRGIYEAKTKDGEPRSYSAYEVVHLSGLGVGSLAGNDPRDWVKDTVGQAIAARNAESEFIAKAPFFGALGKIPANLDAETKKSLKEELKGKRGDAPMLPPNYVIEFPNPQVLNLLEQKRFTGEAVCRFFNVPPAMVGFMTSGMNYNNPALHNRSFYDNCLSAYFAQIEGELESKLLREDELGRVFIRFDTDRFLSSLPPNVDDRPPIDAPTPQAEPRYTQVVAFVASRLAAKEAAAIRKAKVATDASSEIAEAGKEAIGALSELLGSARSSALVETYLADVVGELGRFDQSKRDQLLKEWGDIRAKRIEGIVMGRDGNEARDS